MRKYEFTLEELHNMAADIGKKIYKEHPDVPKVSESKIMCEQIALSAVNNELSGAKAKGDTDART